MGINKRLFTENREAKQMADTPHNEIKTQFEKSRKDLETILSDSIAALKEVEELKATFERNKRYAEGMLAILNEAQPPQ